MDYKKFSAEDFVLDQEFRKWVFSNDEEIESFWNNWIQQNPSKLGEIQDARKILKNLHFPDYKLAPQDKEFLLGNILNQIDNHQSDEVPVRFLSVDSYPDGAQRFPWMKLGVAASLIMALSFVFYLLIFNGHLGQLAYQTDYGQTKNIVLADGSRVTLNANSKLYVGELNDQTAKREVWLEGEAFFDIQHTENHQQFIVHANKIDVTVLGTEFNVYSRGKKSEITLASGKVRLDNRNSQAKVDMKPGDQVTFETPNHAPVKSMVDTQEISAWKNNLLIFRRTSLEEISELLKTNYDIDVFFTNGASTDHYFTGTTPADDVDLLLKSVSKSFDLNVERKGKTVIIKPNL